MRGSCRAGTARPEGGKPVRDKESPVYCVNVLSYENVSPVRKLSSGLLQGRRCKVALIEGSKKLPHKPNLVFSAKVIQVFQAESFQINCTDSTKRE